MTEDLREATLVAPLKRRTAAQCADTSPKTVNQAFVHYTGGGLCVIPIDHRSKRPAMALLPRTKDGKATWAPYINALPDTDTLTKWAMAAERGELQALAVVAGRVSGGLVVLDFDVPGYYSEWQLRAGELAQGLPVQQTGGGGYQVFFRCPTPVGNLKLTWQREASAASGRRIAIETRGEEGYAVVPPSVHPSGNRYQLVDGDLAEIPLLTQEHADQLLDIARDLNESPGANPRDEMETQARTAHEQTRVNDGKRGLIGAYNAAHPIEEVLTAHGYTPAGSNRFVRPGGISASVSVRDGRSCHWSTNDPLNDGAVRDGMGVHDSFDLFCLLDHGGDFAAAIAAAAQEFPDVAAPMGDRTTVAVGGGQSPIALTIENDGGKKLRIAACRDGEIIHADRFDPVSALSRQRFAEAVAAKLSGESQDPEETKRAIAAVTRQVADALLTKLQDKGAPAPAATTAAEPDRAALLDEMPEEIVAAAEDMLADPTLMRRIVQDIAQLGVAGEHLLAATLYVVATSRLLHHPLAARAHGHTSSGKSHVIDMVVRLIPPEDVIRATAMTPQALYHLRPGSLVHRLVAAGERSRLENDEAAEATRALREMLSAGRLSKLMPVKIGNQIETRLIEQDGPIAFMESTTLPRIFDENANRALMLTTDETEEQTRRILRSQAQARGGASPVHLQAIIDRHHALQRIVAQIKTPVRIPFAERLADRFPARRPEARRAFGQVLAMIEAVALLHHRQRTVDDSGILATVEDYRIARTMLSEPMARAIGGGISAGARRF